MKQLGTLCLIFSVTTELFCCAELVKNHPKALTAAAKVIHLVVRAVVVLHIKQAQLSLIFVFWVLDHLQNAGLGKCLPAESGCCYGRAADPVDSGEQQLTSNNVLNLLHAMTHLASCNKEAVSQASGCSTEVTEDDVEEGEVDKLVKGLLQQVTQVARVSYHDAYVEAHSDG